MASVIDIVWFYVVENYGNLASLSAYAPGTVAEIVITRKATIPILIVGLSIAQWAFGVYYATTAQNAHSTSTLPSLAWVSTAGLACNLAGDILITTAMCYNLHKSRSGLKRSDKLINVLIVYTINSGLVPTIVVILAIILSNMLLATFWLLLPFLLIGKCYVNSALAMLRNISATVTFSTIDIAEMESGRLRVQRSSDTSHKIRDKQQAVLPLDGPQGDQGASGPMLYDNLST
ncbi:hypothetical protein CERSUDRAFT_100589 [Gelatoporia subvermispora B]|uniref:DUF6534 domain-containing protein n=1 Tax=Ceriporiopsis subvermispora (strain B) TaxID=914234 RepID=M2QGS2_CERS8|nr:hypothetical protein CERSUDRAFT_100589 [Gelatoporia subvermispora B]